MSRNREDRVRAAFAEQEVWCERLGSPFTARLCGLMARRLGRNTPVGAALLDWPGDPSPGADSLPLRLCGGLHDLVRRGEASELASLYPPGPDPDEDLLWKALERVLGAKSAGLSQWMQVAPQTNEVGRSAVLMSGLLVAASEFAMPIRLYELGASAGLNLKLDAYGYDLGGLEAGDRESRLQMKPDWAGRAPPHAEVHIVGRAGVDLSPMDARTDAPRLVAYVWPDQTERVQQLEIALELAAARPPAIAQGDAADWIERLLHERPEQGVMRAVMHSVAFQYFAAETRARVVRRLDRVGQFASAEAPLAWLRFEKAPLDEHFSLRLRTWPGEDRLLAWAHPHGRWVRWLPD